MKNTHGLLGISVHAFFTNRFSQTFCGSYTQEFIMFVKLCVVIVSPTCISDLNLAVTLFSFLKGDMFIVHNELEDGWMWVTNLRTDEQGLIVEDLVEEVVSNFCIQTC